MRSSSDRAVRVRVIVSNVFTGIPPGKKMGTDEHNAGGNPSMEKQS